MAVFDPVVLRQLVEDTSEHRFLAELARTFRQMLSPRVDRLLVACCERDVDVDLAEAMDAVLSLRVSCTMLGAQELAELAREVEAGIRTGDLPRARARARVMPRAAAELDDALERYLHSDAA